MELREELGAAVERIINETEGVDPSLPSNCLKGWECPKCKNQFRFLIEAVSVFVMYDDGDDGHSTIEYCETDKAQCPACDHQATVGAFAPHTRQRGIDIRNLSYRDIGRKVRYTPEGARSVTECEIGTIDSFCSLRVRVFYPKRGICSSLFPQNLTFVYE
jgi:hypothetical protein